MKAERYFRHFKGGLYKFIGEAKHSETQGELVVYQAMYGDKQIWVRPKEMFYGTTEIDGKQVKRFQEIVPYVRSVADINNDFKLGDVLLFVIAGSTYIGRFDGQENDGQLHFNPCFHVVNGEWLEEIAPEEDLIYEEICTHISKVTKIEFELFRKYEDECDV